MKPHTIGIDFGTSKTLVSHINPQTHVPEPIKLGRDAAYLPTSAYVDAAGHLSFGDEADDMLEDYTGRYLRGFKMQLGSPAPLHVYLDNGRPRMLTAKDLVQKYLQFIRCRVQELVYHGEPVTAATITRPVGFSPAQCEELKQAAHDAGFGTVEFSTEPEAAGLAFCRLNAAQAFKHSALIVDWGGGTLDFALVTRKGDTICTHSSLTDGDATMGGEKFDEKLWLHVEQEMPHKLNPITQLPKIRRAKELLSSRENITLRLSYEGGTCPPLPISRADFNRLIAADIDKAVQKVQALLARIPTEHKPEMLLLVGGSSQIPLIKKQLEDACHLPAHNWHYSREAVAMGAALWKKTPTAGASQQTDTASNNHYELVLSYLPDKVQLDTILQKLSIKLCNEALEKMKASLPGILMTDPTPEPLNNALDTLQQFGAGAYITSPLSCKLRAAIEANNIPLIRDVIQQGADLHAPYVIKDNEALSSETPLSHAAYNNLAEVADLLLQAGANIHRSTTADGRTPLHSAAARDAADVITSLLKSGAYIHAKDNNGWTPIHYAAEIDAAKVLPILISHGANVNEKGKNGWTPLHYAARNDAAEVLPILLKLGANVHEKDEYSETPLHKAAANDAAKVLPILLNHGANVHEKDNIGWTPLHHAAWFDAAKVLPILLDHGAKVNEKDNNHLTPLHLAAEKDAAEVLPILLNYGANVHETEYRFRKPLHLAARNDAAKVLPILLNYGADVNVRDLYSSTPLHHAAECDAAEVLPILFNHGADVNVKNTYGETPLNIAIAKKSSRAESILRNAGAKTRNELSPNNGGCLIILLGVAGTLLGIIPTFLV